MTLLNDIFEERINDLNVYQDLNVYRYNPGEESEWFFVETKDETDDVCAMGFTLQEAVEAYVWKTI